jgi:hypothetical protein
LKTVFKKSLWVSVASILLPIAPAHASLMSVNVGTTVLTDPMAQFGGAFRYTYQYNDSISAVATTARSVNSLVFSQIALGPSYGRFSSQGGAGSFTGSVVDYQFGLNLVDAQVSSKSASGAFVSTSAVVPTGAPSTLRLSVVQGVAVYSLNGSQTISNYSCVYTGLQSTVSVRNQFGNSVTVQLGSEGNFLGGSANNLMCRDGYAFNPDVDSQALFSVRDSRIVLSTELLRFAPNFNPSLTWFTNGTGGLVSAFSASTPVDSGSVPLPGSLALALIGVVGMSLRKRG